MNAHRLIRALLLLAVAATLVGCSANKAYTRAERAMKRENYDQAVLDYSKALASDPGNTRYQVALQRAKLKAAGEHHQKGKRYVASQQWELAIAEFQQVLLLNEGHQFARAELEKAARALQRLQAGPSEIERMKDRARRADLGPPRLDPRTNIPIVLNFRDVEVGKIFEAISKASGINFIFDDKVDTDKPMDIDVGNVSLEKALDILMLQTKNFYKVIDEYTLLIAPDTRQKRQEYEDQVIRTFFLSNADTKQVVTLLRSLLQSRQIAENADLNSVTIKDTPDKVAIAERIITANDKSKGEVLIDLELMEINRNTAKTLGIDLSSKTLSLSFRDGAAAVGLNNLDSLNQQGNWTIGVIPSVILTFLKTDSDTRSIAKPQLRVSEGEQAEILIGDRVPIPTTSFNTSQTVGGNIVPITSFTYQNVGITVQMEPRVHHNREVTLRVQIEVSQITSFVDSPGAQGQPIIGTRQVQTVLRLRDGETNMLAGLIQRSDTDSNSGVPGLSDIPGLRRVFGTNTTNRAETDIVMLLTPRIIRIPDITEQDLATLWVGTEENMKLRGSARNALNQSPFEGSTLFAEAAPEMDLRPREPEPDSPFRGRLERISATAEDAAVPEGDRPPVMLPPPVETGATTPSAPAAGERRGGAPSGAAALPGNPSRSSGSISIVNPTAVGGTETAPPLATEPPPSLDPPGFDPNPTASLPQTGTPQSPRRTTDPDPGADAGDDDLEPPAGPAIVRLVPSRMVFGIGDVVDVQVVLENGENVASVPFHLRYNTQVLNFVSPAVEGEFLRRDGTNTVFLATDTGGGGEIVVGHSRMGASVGVSGSGVLATLRFQAVGPGPANFEFIGASVKDPRARNLAAAFSPIALSVE